MKNLMLIIILALFTPLAWAASALYTSASKEPHPLSEMNEILEQFTRESPEKNILFYVHGRNHHLDKELKRISTMEAAYNIKVVMLRWEAWTTMVSRPVDNAALTAGPLNEAFIAIRDFKESHREFFLEHKISLLCHSMGNLVLKNFTEKYINQEEYNSDTPLFENYMGVGADVPLLDHQAWLSKFNLAKNKHIFMNNRDLTLLLSYSLDLRFKNPFQYRLGLGFDNYPGKRDDIKSKLVSDVAYIDLSGVLESHHGYFASSKPLMQNIFSKLVNGLKFQIDSKEKSQFKVKIKVDNNIYYLKKK